MVVSLSRCQDDIIVTHEIHKIMTSTSNNLSHTDPPSLTLSLLMRVNLLNLKLYILVLNFTQSSFSYFSCLCCYVKSILTFINNCSNKIRNPPGVIDIFQRKNLQIPPSPVFWRRSVILEQISAQTQNTQKSKSFACEALFSV